MRPENLTVQVINRLNVPEEDKPKMVELVALFRIGLQTRNSDMPERAGELFDSMSQDSVDAFK